MTYVPEHDYNTAETGGGSFDLVPANTIARVILSIRPPRHDRATTPGRADGKDRGSGQSGTGAAHDEDPRSGAYSNHPKQ